MKLFRLNVNGNVIVVVVDANELMCDGGRPLPYSAYIGTINLDTRKIRMWTPAAYVPRGYKPAALRKLEEVNAKLDPKAVYPMLGA
jgi:hypothetical protein